MRDTSHKTAVSGMRTGWGLIFSYWTSHQKSLASLYVLGLGAVIGANGLVGWKAAKWLKDSYDALWLDGSSLASQSMIGIGLCFGFLACAGAREILSRRLHIQWRGWLTEQFVNAYTGDKAFFHLHNIPNRTGDPAQIIAEDCSKLQGNLIGLATGGFQALVTLGVCTNLMWNLSETVPVHILGQTIPTPISFLLGTTTAALCAGAAMGVSYWIGKPLVPLNRQQLRWEAYLRNDLLEISNKATIVASYDRQSVEREKLMRDFAGIKSVWNKLANVHAMLQSWNAFYENISKGASLGIGAAAFSLSKRMAMAHGAPGVITAGAMTIGGMMQFSAVFDQLRNSLSWPVQVYPAVLEARTLVKRMNELASRIEDAQSPHIFYGEDGTDTTLSMHKEARDSILISDLLLKDNMGNLLISIPELEIHQGERILISGKSGAGKSMLLRSMCGLYYYGSGHVVMPSGKTALYAGQEPRIIPNATLRDNVCYPHPPQTFSENSIRQALTQVRLEDLMPYLDREDKEGTAWGSLSTAQRQRVAAARLFLHKPDIILWDDAMSALDSEFQNELYGNLLHCNPDVTVIRIAQQEDKKDHYTSHYEVKNCALYKHPIEPLALNEKDLFNRKKQPVLMPQ